jgi:RsiW-degrading membrane proteinase PrsW (M82 family)
LPVSRRVAYLIASVSGAISIAVMVWVVTTSPEPSVSAVFVAAASAVVAMLSLAWGRIGVTLRWRTLLTGAAVGYVAALALFLLMVLPIAIASPAVEDFLQAYVTNPGSLLEFDSRSVVMFLVMTAVFAPLSEEPAKALAGTLARPPDRRRAFLAGATAGAGFAILEHALYAAGVRTYIEAWKEVLVLRSLGSALHPLASALVLMGFWEWRNGGSVRAVVVGLLSGLGLHALWNETVVVSGVVQAGAEVGDVPGFLGPVVLGYSGLLGVALMVALFKISGAVGSRDAIHGWRVSDPGSLPVPVVIARSGARGAWILLSAALVVPAVVMMLVYPSVF